jgi:hypothetical protein
MGNEMDILYETKFNEEQLAFLRREFSKGLNPKELEEFTLQFNDPKRIKDQGPGHLYIREEIDKWMKEGKDINNLFTTKNK